MKRKDIYAAIDTERLRQEELHPGDTCASVSMWDAQKMLILTEEVGEVARAILDHNPEHGRKELVEVAAVAVAWLESL